MCLTIVVLDCAQSRFKSVLKFYQDKPPPPQHVSPVALSCKNPEPSRRSEQRQQTKAAQMSCDTQRPS